MLPRLRAAPIFLALVSFAFLAARAAQAAETVHVRGTVEKLEGSTLTVKTREGPTDTLLLGQGWKISGVAKASVGDIKPGDFVGVTSVAKAKGGNGALEVLIFPAALKGTGEGSRPWDLKPKSTMTNGTVGDAVKAVDGRTITVSYHGQTKTITIPDGTPVVTLAPATAADLKPGAAVFVMADKTGNGKLSAVRIVVGNHGVIPPM
jgi:hypothetical protein